MTLLNKADYARLKGWSKAYLSKESVVEKLKPAMEPDPKKPSRMLVNVEKADEIFKKTNDPAAYIGRQDKSAASDEDEEDSYSSAKRDLARLNVETAQIQLAKLKGQLLNRQEVFDAAAKYGQLIRERIMGMAPTLAEKVALMTDSREIKAVFVKEFTNTLEVILRDLQQELNRISQSGQNS